MKFDIVIRNISNKVDRTVCPLECAALTSRTHRSTVVSSPENQSSSSSFYPHFGQRTGTKRASNWYSTRTQKSNSITFSFILSSARPLLHYPLSYLNINLIRTLCRYYLVSWDTAYFNKARARNDKYEDSDFTFLPQNRIGVSVGVRSTS